MRLHLAKKIRIKLSTLTKVFKRFIANMSAITKRSNNIYKIEHETAHTLENTKFYQKKGNPDEMRTPNLRLSKNPNFRN